jgi:flagellar biosynthesis protein FlhA
MPHVFLLIASGLGYAAYWMRQRDRQTRPPGTAAVRPVMLKPEATWDDLQPIDTLGLEVGYRLISLVDKAREGDLLGRIKGVRKSLRRTSAFCRRRCTSATTWSSNPACTA